MNDKEQVIHNKKLFEALGQTRLYSTKIAVGNENPDLA